MSSLILKTLDLCNLYESIGVAWFRLGIWKRRGRTRDAEKGRCPVCNEEGNMIHIFPKCKERERERERDG
jgi:hypothetical protein